MAEETKQTDALQSWAEQAAALFEAGMDFETADSVRTIVAQYITESERQACGRVGTLREHTVLRRTIRLTDGVLDRVKEENEDALKGWRYGLQPTNAAQNIYAVLYALAQEMSFAKFGIEAEYPHLAEQFDTERREYAAALAMFRAEVSTQV